jgi:hypothetical protein
LEKLGFRSCLLVTFRMRTICFSYEDVSREEIADVKVSVGARNISPRRCVFLLDHDGPGVEALVEPLIEKLQKL